MVSRGTRIGVTFACLVAGAACSSATADGDRLASASVCADHTAALSIHFERCGLAGVRSAHRLARVQADCVRAISAPGASRLGSVLAACDDQLRSGDCAQALLCSGSSGTLEDGAPCAEHYQCRGGACHMAPDSSCGSCGRRLPIGAACTDRDRCVEGALCGASSEGGTCAPWRVGKEGERCATSDALVVCAPGLRCSLSPDPRCVPRGKTGEPCHSRAECDEDLVCIDETCSIPLGEGVACTRDDACGPSLGCDPTTKTCVRRIFVKAGEACDHSVRFCEKGTCENASVSEKKLGTCVDPIPDGGACSKGGPPYCDTFAECIDGRCVLPDLARCN